MRICLIDAVSVRVGRRASCITSTQEDSLMDKAEA